MNILVLSCGTRNKVLQYFKEALKGQGNLIATDMQMTAPALYEADKFYQVPCMTAENYLNVIYDICKKENVGAVLSLIDPELSLLAEHSKEFQSLGVKVIGSSYELCEMSLDKFEMYKWLCEHGYQCAKSYMNFDEFEESGVNYPVFVKPARGSASISIAKAEDKETAQFCFNRKTE